MSVRAWLSMPVLGLALAGGCSEPVDATDHTGKEDGLAGDVVTEWEYDLGSYHSVPGARKVTPWPDGGLIVTTTKWVRKLTLAGDDDETWGLPYPNSFGGPPDPESARRVGVIEVPAHQVWPVGDGLGAAGGDGDLFYLFRYLANGRPSPTFGDHARVDLPLNTGKPLRVAYDETNKRFLAVVARDWEISGPFAKGPSKLELVAYDQDTGAATSAGTFDMPSWINDGTNPARIHELLIDDDGSFILIVSETVRPQGDVIYIGSQWSMIRLEPSAAPTVTRLAMTDYDIQPTAIRDLGAGGFDLYLAGAVDGVSTTKEDVQLVRVSVGDDGAPELVVLGPDPGGTKGCRAADTTESLLVVAQALDQAKPVQFTAYPKSGTPITFEADNTERCPISLTIAPDGRYYAGVIESKSSGWRQKVVSYARE